MRSPAWEQGSETSEAAARAVADKAPSYRWQIHMIIKRAADGGMTDDELEVVTGLTHQCASARRRELVLAGLVKDSGVTRLTRSGRRAVVWVLGDQGTINKERYELCSRCQGAGRVVRTYEASTDPEAEPEPPEPPKLERNGIPAPPSMAAIRAKFGLDKETT